MMQTNRPRQTDFLSAKVLVVGDLMLDRYWFGEVDRISPEAPVPVVLVRQVEERLGGAANVARNIRALGVQVTLMGVVGADEAGGRVQALLDQANIRQRLTVDGRIPTTVKLRILGRGQQLLRADFEESPSFEVLSDKLDEFKIQLQGHAALVLSDYGKGGLTHIGEMIKAAKTQGLMVLVDPKGIDYQRYRGADLLTPNRSELRMVVGPWRDEEHLQTLVCNLCEHLELPALLLTRSEEGMTLFSGSEKFHVAAQAREVFDVSGAGDTVIATLASFLAAGASLRDAVVWANRAGGIVVGKLGTATVTAEELFGSD